MRGQDRCVICERRGLTRIVVGKSATFINKALVLISLCFLGELQSCFYCEYSSQEFFPALANIKEKFTFKKTDFTLICSDFGNKVTSRPTGPPQYANFVHSDLIQTNAVS